uniref:Uncharacterized protein n=1 Tax=Anguilla anguilla TaxID=7936 RepID=A0A0E9VD60_ANGAN
MVLFYSFTINDTEPQSCLLTW